MAGESTLNGTSTAGSCTAVRRAPGAARMLRVLVAEEHPVDQPLIADLLQQRGHLATLASNGPEALLLSATQHFDVILMDGQMPEMDGYAATREIRRREAQDGGHVPIIAVTAHAGARQRQVCLDAGMDDYVSRPIDPDLLFDCLESAASAGRIRSVREVTTGAPMDSTTCRGHDTADGTPIFNREAALERVGGSPAFLRQLNDMFLAELPTMIDAITAAAARDDAIALESLSHQLRGAAITVGGEALAAAASALEDAARDQQWARMADWFACVGLRAGQLDDALRAYAVEPQGP